MIVFFLPTSLELVSIEPMASPGGKGSVYSNEPSVGQHLRTTQERQRVVALLVSGAHLRSLTRVGFPFISGLVQTPSTVQLAGTSETSSLSPSLSLLAKPTTALELTLFNLTQGNWEQLVCMQQALLEAVEIPCQFASSKSLAQDVFYFNFYVCT